MTITARSSLEGGPRLWTREKTRRSAGRHRVANIIHSAPGWRKRLRPGRPGRRGRPGRPRSAKVGQPGLVRIEAVPREGIDELTLLVGEVGEQGVGEQVRGAGKFAGLGGLADVV